MTIATERAKRPRDFARGGEVETSRGGHCPFCPGNEGETPPEVMAYRTPGNKPDTPGWQVRVVPNLYPAFHPQTGDPDRRTEGPYATMKALGVHEVLISSPDHRKDIGALPIEAVELIVRSYVERYLAHRSNPIVRYILIINNVGHEAGASREHPHSQLFGIPLVPEAVTEEMVGAANYRKRHDACPYCHIVQFELQAGSRVIYQNDQFLVFSPFASRVPFESWVIPKVHRPFFEEMSVSDQLQFADALRTLVAKLHVGLNKPPFNYFIHTTPCHDSFEGLYHWHLELWPKLSVAAGFELGSGMMINTALPEQAAKFLRSVST